MERVQELIDKLREQYQQGTGPEQLLQTVQSLKEVLVAMMRKEVPASSKVSIVMPPKRRPTTVEVGVPAPALKPVPPVAAVPLPQPQIKRDPAPAIQEIEQPNQQQPAERKPDEIEPEVPATYAAYMPVAEPQKEKEPYLLQKPPLAEPAAPAPPQRPQWEEREVYHLHLDMPEEAPTLTQQQFGKAPRELHEVISEARESLNDRLKQDKPELAHKLKEVPIKDLRKAIGVNDKFLFVRELFRGDEAMYERSIKTINAFHILAEAEYWISRELKVKLGWEDSSHTVQAFYQLVKRRFS